LTGEIPPEIGNLTNLTYLSLNYNQLTGEIPSEIGNLTSLTTLSLYVNQLTGEIPPEIGQLTNLERLWLNDNQLTGFIPSEIGNLTSLTTLSLYNNQLSGEIPESICYIDNEINITLRNNQLCPPYPTCLSPNNVGDQNLENCETIQCELGYIEKDGFCYYQSDLDVLQQFIDNSQEGENPPPSDLPPIELGIQEWEDGRLVEFIYTWVYDFIINEYKLSGEIPSEIGNLTNLN